MEVFTSAEKPSYGVTKMALLAWTPDATNMAPLLKNNGGLEAHVSSIAHTNDVPLGQRQQIDFLLIKKYAVKPSTNLRCIAASTR